MCGIAGMVSLREGLPPPTLEQLNQMAGALSHRGPDALGIYRDASAGLAHTRLSIVDLASGNQPLCNADGSLWVVFNGEIYNHVELRAELEKKHLRFRTRSDTEVIVQAYAAWGEAAFERFNGQWALALWDHREKKLVLSRDRLGVRPLYLCEHGRRLFFASEVKALFAADPGIPRALDPAGLDQTFTFWTVVPPQTVFRGVTELEPGHLRTYQWGEMSDRPYWRPSYQDTFSGTLEDAVAAVRAALERATRLRMLRADVPVGSYLSGGLDSSLVAAMGQEANGQGFQTFSVRFADAEYDESGYQRLMTRRLSSTHHEVQVTRRDIALAFPQVVLHTEQPILRTAPAPMFLLSKKVQEAGVKVVLTGEGADELFAGYDLFREGRVRRFWARQPGSSWRPRLLERLYPYLARSPVSQRAMTRQFFGQHLERWRAAGFSHEPRWSTTSALKRLFCDEQQRAVRRNDPAAHLLSSLPPELPGWSFLAQDQYLEVRTLLSGYLLSSQGDRMLMAHSVEGRFPFLDPEVVALANSLPDSYKLRVLDEKYVLKRAAAGRVPEEIVGRKKQPYRAPDAASFLGPGAPEYVAELTSRAALSESGVFDPAAVAALWTKCTARAGGASFSNSDNMAVVGVLSTQLLYAQLVKGRPTPGCAPPRTVVEDHLSGR
ncbi:MAG: asparagine synthase (glutamine-hydrolyzing) [Myxococcaceae bacterium]